MYDEIRKFNYMGDTQYISSEITGKREEQGQYLVDLKVKMTNQRGEDTVYCDATVSLPSRKNGVVLLPEPPQELKLRAVEMMRRHWELTARQAKA
jgi:hypothetical protein